MISDESSGAHPRLVIERVVDSARFADEGLTFIRELHLLLATRRHRANLPLLNRESEQPAAQAHWNACLHLLVGLLGWEDPGLGLQRWYARENDPALADDRLALLRPVFDNEDEVLDLFALQLWERGSPNSSSPERRPAQFRGEDWVARVLKRFRGWRDPYRADPYHGGTNGLHLSDLSRSCDWQSAGEVIAGAPERRRAFVRIPRLMGWGLELDRLGSRLPALAHGRSWRIDVVVEEVGWLGTFRQSRVSGRWFQGRHRVHELGTPTT